LAALAGASLGLIVFRAVSAAEAPVTVEYQSAFAGYRYFDAQAPAVEWRQANDAIRVGAEGASHGMHDMQAPMEAAPARGDDSVREAMPQPSPDAVAPHSGHESQPTTPGDHQEHRR